MYFIAKRLVISYANLMKQITQTQGTKKIGTAFSAYEIHSRPLTPENQSKGEEMVAIRKLNKIEQAKEKLIQRIFDCCFKV